MTATGIIPARFDSKRFKGKVLEVLQGKPLIWHVYNKATQSKLLDKVIIATDNEKVKRVAEDFGAEVFMTTSDVNSGTDRVAQVAESLSSEVIVNIQADEPLIPPSLIDLLVQTLNSDTGLNIVTAAYRMSNVDLLKDPNVVKVVMDRNNFALYFSRSLIPYPRDKENFYTHKHLGIYAYRREFLLNFTTWQPGELELIEALEQLRILGYGYKIKVIESDYDSIGVDIPEDLEKVRRIMENLNA